MRFVMDYVVVFLLRWVNDELQYLFLVTVLVRITASPTKIWILSLPNEYKMKSKDG